MSYVLEGYVDVAERLREFRAKYPNGCLRPANPDEPFKLMEIGGREFIVYTACAYRHPEDTLPAIAVAAEPSIGKTNFTRDSELMNAETSAWGRAIVALLVSDTQRVASMEEVRNRQTNLTVVTNEEQTPTKAPSKAKEAHPSYVPSNVTPLASSATAITSNQKNLIAKLMKEKHVDDLAEFATHALQKTVEGLDSLSKVEASKVISALMSV